MKKSDYSGLNTIAVQTQTNIQPITIHQQKQHNNLSPDNAVNTNIAIGETQHPKGKNWRTIVDKASSVRAKVTEIDQLIECIQPDQILITETKLVGDDNK